MTGGRPERAFIEAIDCRFPYDDADAAHALIDEACELSASAAFMVAHELARRPRSATTTDATCLSLLDRLEARMQHASKAKVLAIARQMVRRQQVDLDTCCDAMRHVAANGICGTAMALITFACSDEDADAVQALHEQLAPPLTAADAPSPTEDIAAGTEDERRGKILAVSKARDARYLPQLLARLTAEPAEANRRHIARALGNIGGPDAERALLACLQDPSPGIVGDAAGSLGRLRTAAAAATLEALQTHDDPWIRQNATFAMRQLRRDS